MVQKGRLSHLSYRPDIDGLRAIAVLAVVAFHAFPKSIRGGFIGVDVFFVISGYLISTIIFESLEKGTFSLSEFYARRIKRIFPALLLVLVTCFAFGWFALLADEYKQLGKHIASGVSFISNLVFWNEAGYFDNAADTKPLLHLWSLGIEEQFYMVWPLLLWFSWKRKFNLLLITILIATASFVLSVNVIKSDAIAAFYSPQTRFWELLSGSLLAWLTLNRSEACAALRDKVDGYLHSIFYKKLGPGGKVLSNTLSLFGFLLLAYGFWQINKDLSFPGKWALVPVISTVLLIAAGSEALINRTILSNKVIVWFGLISFPLYLWHWPLLSFARIVESEVPSRNIRMAAIVMSIFLAWITYKFIEGPIRFGKHGKIKVALLVFFGVIVGGLGYNAYVRDGYEFRNSIKAFANNKNELIRTPSIDDECLKYTGLTKPLFPYCRFTNVSSSETVAVIGDSHAHVAYPGIAEYLKGKGINTLLLANSGCAPFLDSYLGGNQLERNACKNGVEELLATVSSHKEIRRVFIFTRGPIYITGTEPLTGNKALTGGNIIPIMEFANSAQLFIDRLSNSGKSVFYITENPELNYSVESCLNRPFKSVVRNCSVAKNVVLQRQSDYLNAFNNLKNVTVIDSLRAFCPQNDCIVFDGAGSLLYADDDHLSVAGSRFQLNQLLMPFLE